MSHILQDITSELEDHHQTVCWTMHELYSVMPLPNYTTNKTLNSLLFVFCCNSNVIHAVPIMYLFFIGKNVKQFE